MKIKTSKAEFLTIEIFYDPDEERWCFDSEGQSEYPPSYLLEVELPITKKELKTIKVKV